MLKVLVFTFLVPELESREVLGVPTTQRAGGAVEDNPKIFGPNNFKWYFCPENSHLVVECPLLI